MAGVSCPSSLGEQDTPELKVDRLSSLPFEALDHILGKLSILDAVRTSVLAKDWRYKWLGLSKFSLTSDLNLRWHEATGLIHKYLRDHKNPIQTFSLETHCSDHYPDLYYSLQYLSKQDIQEMLLKNIANQRFKLPSYLFMFEKLKCLSLDFCAIRMPSTPVNFNFLQELRLCNVLMNDDSFDRLICACPCLLTLKVQNVCRVRHMRINSPALTMLEVDTGYESIIIGASSCLVSVIINPTYNLSKLMTVIVNWRSVTSSLSSLNFLQNLTLSGKFIKILADDYALDDFPLRNNTLTFLSLDLVRFENVEVFRACLSLLSSCPNIKYFQFNIESAKGQKLITAFLKENQGRFSFSKLESLKVICHPGTGMGCTVNFIEYLCAHAPNLKAISIERGGKLEMNATRVAKMLSKFRKYRPNALIQYTFNGQQTHL